MFFKKWGRLRLKKKLTKNGISPYLLHHHSYLPPRKRFTSEILHKDYKEKKTEDNFIFTNGIEQLVFVNPIKHTTH